MPSPQQLPILGASACVWRDGKVLLIKRGKQPGKGLWSLPGGKVEFGETAQAAAARELQEEAGVVAELQKLVGLYEIVTPQVHFAVACYGGPYLSGVAQAASDAEAVAWVDPKDLAQYVLAPNIVEAIRDSVSP
ncbi:MAG: NUDIX hydrolase [Alphaproteobacteria bacterium]|nr:NUDIX hydrolase [Alphaproteobacteria bacterium]